MNAVRRVVVVVIAVACCGWGAAAQAALVRPSDDPFYAYSGPMKDLAPGTVLRTRTVSINVANLPGIVSATQVLYRTTNQRGEPSTTVATIVKPPTQGITPTRLISYQTFYDGVADTCRPSYALQGGNPNSFTAAADSTFLFTYLAQGYTVVTSDYEGPTDDFGAGREEAYNTLDGVRAAEAKLHLDPKTTPVGMLGYSGGSIASSWSAQVAPDYAPELNIVGVAAGGVPVHFPHTLEYINGSQDWSAALPAVGIGLARAYGFDLNQYLSPRGEQVVNEVSKGCLTPGAYPGLRFEDLLKPQYQDWKKVPDFVRALNDGIMGRGSTPKAPMFLAVGNADGTGDGVMVAQDVQQLAYEYCQRGLPVQLHQYQGADHDQAAVAFEPEALTYLAQRFAGLPAPSDCASITPGGNLDPLPGPSGDQGSAGSAGAGAGKASPKAAGRGSGLALSGVRCAHGRCSATLRATTSSIRNVQLRLYRVSGARRLLVGRTTVPGTIGVRGRRVSVPLRAPKHGARYALEARGTAGTARVIAVRSFRAA